MSKPVLGAQLYTVRDFCKTIDGIAESLKKIAQIGYPTVQVSGFGPVDPKDVAAIFEDNQLICSATHMGWNLFRDELDEVIETHKLWKCSHPAIGGLPEEYRTAEGIRRFLDELGPIAERLAAEGMDFSYHNHHRELATTTARRGWACCTTPPTRRF